MTSIPGELQRALEAAAEVMDQDELSELTRSLLGDEIMPVGLRVGGFEWDGVSFHAKPAITMEEITREQTFADKGLVTEANEAANVAMKWEIKEKQSRQPEK